PGGDADPVDDDDRDQRDGQGYERLAGDVGAVAKGGQSQLSPPALLALDGGLPATADRGGHGTVDGHRDHDVQGDVAAADVLRSECLRRAEDDVHEGREDGDEEQADVVAADPFQLQSDDRRVHRASSASSVSAGISSPVMARKAASSEAVVTSRLVPPSSVSSSRARASESSPMAVTRSPAVVTRLVPGR